MAAVACCATSAMELLTPANVLLVDFASSVLHHFLTSHICPSISVVQRSSQTIEKELPHL